MSRDSSRNAGLAAVRALLRAVLCCSVGAASAAEVAKTAEAPVAHRFYGGVGLGNLGFDDRYGGLRFSDSTFGLALFGGVYLKERLAIEISYDSLDAIRLRDVAGSGTVRFDIDTHRRTEAVSVLREVSMRDILGWKRDWRLFGSAGIYKSALRRSITPAAAVTAPLSDDVTGLVLGAGVLYRVSGLDLRGYVREFGATDRREGSEIGFGVQRRF
jgi:hypothetical protein